MTQPNEQLTDKAQAIISLSPESIMLDGRVWEMQSLLRALLEENKRLTSDRDYWFELSMQERELSKGQKEHLSQELEQVKAEQEKLKEFILDKFGLIELNVTPREEIILKIAALLDKVR